MKAFFYRSMRLCAAAAAALLGVIAGSISSSMSVVEIQGGSAAFEVSTNVPGIEVKGKSAMLSASVSVQRDANGLLLEQITASFPVNSLKTGMEVRDEHMRKYIFTTADGKEPDVQFVAEKGACAPGRSAREFDCDVSGNLAIRGIARPLTMKLQVKEQAGSSPEFHAAGSAGVDLKDYGIQVPSQLGVRTSTNVKLHLSFTGRQKSLMALNAGDVR